ncbi:hypothetical protein HMPREF0578_1029 [Mobiluncus mulieris 28-1]|uniref:hypothetical protein n=1 Tax=Mobiluncus mulieris TaxID=2052 RepID=UPI0001BE7BA4|nr:hypothetical protein [Mobiluncus mulieris]EEZ91787.1 hypothetical protein HMPREF0578_1029 [Mobiluncus mulieris 28-1]
MKKPIRLITAGAAVVALSLSTVGVASAAPVAQPDPVTTQTQSSLSEVEIAQLAAELEVLFTRYVQLGANNQFAVNEANLRADGYSTEQVQGLRSLSYGLNTGTFQTRDAGSFALCVAMEGLGIPGGKAHAGLIAAIKEGIRAWNWGLTAKTVARIIGASAVKALGGPVAIGVQLGIAAWNCRGEL